MVAALRKTAANLGYDDPMLVVNRMAWMSASFTLATIASKFFISDLNIKSHFTFGQVISLTFNPIYYNQHIGRNLEENPNPLKKDVYFLMHFLACTIIPLAIGKLVVSKCFENVSWMQAGKQTLYFGGAGIAILCASEIYKRERRK